MRLRPRPQYRNAASHASPYRPLRPNMTSSIKPEVGYIMYRNPSDEARATATGICTTNFVKIGPAVPEILLADRQTNTQTDVQRDRETHRQIN